MHTQLPRTTSELSETPMHYVFIMHTTSTRTTMLICPQKSQITPTSYNSIKDCETRTQLFEEEEYSLMTANFRYLEHASYHSYCIHLSCMLKYIRSTTSYWGYVFKYSGLEVCRTTPLIRLKLCKTTVRHKQI